MTDERNAGDEPSEHCPRRTALESGGGPLFGASDRWRRWLATCAVVVLLGLVAFAGGVSAGHGGAGNFTVDLDGPPDHEPGEDNASVALLSVNTKDISYLEEAAIRYPEGVPSKCYRPDVRALGIDRDNDESGASIDETVLPYASGTQRSTHELVIEFNDQDDPTGTSTNLAAGDQFVLSAADCLQNPEDPGWYLMETKFTGAETESDTYTSHYVWICDCENGQQAREQLGPPPSEPTPTPSATATPTTTPTPTPTPTATPAATATDTETADAEPTATPADGGTERPSTATGTPTGTAAAGADAEPTATATEAGTETDAGGDGFGAAVGVMALALVVTATLARRRWSR